MFEKAARLKLRWNYKGICSVEDLWDLHFESLDTIYRGLIKHVRTLNEESLLEEKSSESDILFLKIAIVKYIFGVKSNEKEERENNMIKAAHRENLLSILARKKTDALQELSEDELQQLIDNSQ